MTKMPRPKKCGMRFDIVFTTLRGHWSFQNESQSGPKVHLKIDSKTNPKKSALKLPKRCPRGPPRLPQTLPQRCVPGSRGAPLLPIVAKMAPYGHMEGQKVPK